ncbi:MAG: hypothetical protein LBK45_06015 [Tannerellaceae bacterium]|jgi:hypothetical protein|nr:hypothetical protein [Tannerellaceae bacterium]
MDFTKYLPSPEMQADFETYRKLSPEERKQFQKERARRIKSGTPEEQAAFEADTMKSLKAIKDRLDEIKMRLERQQINTTI